MESVPLLSVHPVRPWCENFRWTSLDVGFREKPPSHASGKLWPRGGARQPRSFAGRFDRGAWGLEL
eukprot:scaffold1272_cov250-Pinguiococcus_pyrenoidosus.AAC.66